MYTQVYLRRSKGLGSTKLREIIPAPTQQQQPTNAQKDEITHNTSASWYTAGLSQSCFHYYDHR